MTRNMWLVVLLWALCAVVWVTMLAAAGVGTDHFTPELGDEVLKNLMFFSTIGTLGGIPVVGTIFIVGGLRWLFSRKGPRAVA